MKTTLSYNNYHINKILTILKIHGFFDPEDYHIESHVLESTKGAFIMSFDAIELMFKEPADETAFGLKISAEEREYMTETQFDGRSLL